MRVHHAGQPEVSFTEPLANIIRKRSQRTNDRETWSCHEKIHMPMAIVSDEELRDEVLLPVAMGCPVGQATLALLGRPEPLFQGARCPTESA